MTPEELVRKSPHFEIIMHQLRKKYPYIVGYELPSEFNQKWDEYKYNFFVSLIISKSKALEVRPNWVPEFWVDGFDEFDSIFLGVLFDEKEGESGPTPQEDELGIDDTFRKYYESKSIPQEIKLPKQPGVSKYILRA